MGRERSRAPGAGRGRRWPGRASGRPLAGERAGGDRTCAAVGGRRELEPRERARGQGSRARACVRGGREVQLTYGEYGGRFVPETLIPALDELEAGWRAARDDPTFHTELDELGRGYAGRPTLLTLAERFAPGKRLYLKREDLLHTGAHKLNNAIGQALLAVRMGKRRIVAETGAGQHGVATATACALLGLDCVVYMGAEDMARQAPNVLRMRLLGAAVCQVDAGSRTLKDAINEAMRDWVTNVADSYYLLGSVLGPHPYPLMVREFQSVIGQEARRQCLEAVGRLPDAIVACVGGGSNAIGIFDAFVADRSVRLIGVEAGGRRIEPG